MVPVTISPKLLVMLTIISVIPLLHLPPQPQMPQEIALATLILL